MTRHFCTLALGLLLAAGASAATLTPDQAIARASSDRSLSKKMRSRLAANPRLMLTTKTQAGDPALYVFSSAAASDGFMILSADDVAYPLLGYADKGSFNPDNMAPAMRWWLDEYARQIAWAKANGREGTERPQAPEGRRDIAPLVKTRWDQGEPYNQLCPIVNGGRSYTGCVATAMAQIMYYFKYPACGTGSISYNDEGSGKRLTWDFSKHPFDWDNMLLNYSNNNWTEAQAAAVANLMKSAGASVKMAYSADSSGALSVLTPQAFTKYFGYDPNLKFMLRSYVSSTEWDRMMYDNLDKVGPVLCGGGSFIGGGHSFVADGYQASTGLFHFNWGWSEMSDGYFALNALNPSALGAGGGGGGGYNFDQDAVFGIQKPTGQPAEKRLVQMTQFGTLEGKIKEGTKLLQFTLADHSDAAWINYTGNTIKVTMGVSVQTEGATDTIVRIINDKPQTMPAGYGLYPANYISQVDLSTLNMEEGANYKFTIVSLMSNIEGQQTTWVPVIPCYGENNYITVKKNGNDYDITSQEGLFYTVDDIEFETGLYYGCLAKMKYKLTNKNDIEITRGIAPVLYQGTTPYFLGESKLITIAPGQTVEGEVITDLYAMTNDPFGITSDTEMYVSLYEEVSGRVLTDECLFPEVMHPNPGLPGVSVSDYGIEGQNAETLEIPDASDMHITATLTLKQGRVAYPLCAAILGEFDASGNAQIIDYVGQPAFLSNPGDTFTLDTHFNFSSGVAGRKYNMMLCYVVANQLNPILNPGSSSALRQILRTFVVPDGQQGIDGIEMGSNANAKYFNLQGVPVDFETAPGGIYVRVQGGKSSKVIKR